MICGMYSIVRKFRGQDGEGMKRWHGKKWELRWEVDGYEKGCRAKGGDVGKDKY